MFLSLFYKYSKAILLSYMAILIVFVIAIDFAVIAVNNNIDWISFFGDGIVALLIIGWILILYFNKDDYYYKPHSILLIGFMFSAFSFLIDSLDEVYFFYSFMQPIEDALLLVGTLIITLGMFFWVSLKRRIIQSLRALSKKDPLTGLYNRLGFAEQSKILFENCKFGKNSLTIMVVDIDSFKAVNDRCGHITGDNVLIGVSSVLNRFLREDDIVCRWGGDEFILLLTDRTLKENLSLSDKITEHVREDYFFCEAGEKFSVSVSIGMANYNRLDKDIEQIISRADSDMYINKRKKNIGR